MGFMESFYASKIHVGILTIRSVAGLVCRTSWRRSRYIKGRRLRSSQCVIRGGLEQLVGEKLHAASANAILYSGAAIMSKGGTSVMPQSVVTTVKDVFITAVAIASGACLSTKVDFLWPKGDRLPERVELEGVDITGCRIFSEPMVQKAVAFARNAHHGQMRKTGEPYLSHCINTGRILATLVPSTGQRAINTVVAGIIHDVVDDAGESLKNIELEFGPDVVSLVAGVSKLSSINQVLRRRRRINSRTDMLETDLLPFPEVDNLRTMLLGMVNDPRVLLIKLADRLHNMRTIYVLPPEKAQALAQETLAIWCPLGSRLGVWALKAELEDLCFAVLQPQLFRSLRAELAALWSFGMEQRPKRRVMRSIRRRLNMQREISTFHKKDDFGTESEQSLKGLIEAVIPFELLFDRGRRSHMFNNYRNSSYARNEKPKVVCDAETAIMSLVACEEALEKELLISTSYIPGMEVTLSGRLKSLYSTYCKMKRKGVPVENIYDARALRVIIGDDESRMHAAAVECCYNLLNVVHRLWTPLDGEFDDYIVNPKPTGYQSLHTSVEGPDGSPLEVQIRTQSMHEHAEFGHAAHWLYKETPLLKSSVTFPVNKSAVKLHCEAHDCTRSNHNRVEEKVDPLNLRLSSVTAGHPALRVEDSRLFAAVIVRVENFGRELLVAVNFSVAACETLLLGKSNPTKRWELYARLYKKQDQFQRLLPASIHLLHFSKEDKEEYWDVVSSIFDGKEIDIDPSSASHSSRRITMESTHNTPVEQINNKVSFLRTMLKWEEQLHHEAFITMVNDGVPTFNRSSLVLTEVAVILWPSGQIMRMPLGSTTADAARRLGSNGHFVFVNGHIAPPNTKLSDGDIVEVKA
eukprot:TRINITY_DN7312_c0_g1_i2.p1 TRINITY_DN7312_c0_g1~~TRINITY_DN7312_c0_g1_i2.p1  ORF type:complete len:863 (-),score=149.96 TRINITY_DN7312_c0_g1_i2:352-2940(-)